MIGRRPRLSPAFIRLAWSNLAAQAAEQIGLAAVPMVAVLQLGAGVGETGLLAAAQSLPFLLLALPIGVLADRMPRRRLMAIAEGLRAATLIVLPVVAICGRLSVPVLAVLGFLGATGTVAYNIAAPALVPGLVDKATLAAANGRLELARSVAFAAGPAIAGAIVAWTDATPAFVLAAMLSALAASLLARLAEPPRAPAARRAMLAELYEGAAFVARHDLLRPIMLTAVTWNIAWFVLQSAYIPFAIGTLGLSAGGVGRTLGGYGLGMVAGALLAPRIARALPFGIVIALGPLASVAAAVAMALCIRFHGPVLPMLAFFLFGAGPILWTIAQTTLRQAATPPALLGRVSALMTMATFGARPIGAALGAMLGARYGASACILVAAAGFVAQAAIILLSAVPSLAAIPQTRAT